MAGNRIELCGRIVGDPELRTTPAGTSVLRLGVDCGPEPGVLTLAVLMTGKDAARVGTGLRVGTTVRVRGSLKAVHRRLKSGLFETEYEVLADSIVAEQTQDREE